MALNKAMFIGNVGKNPDVRFIESSGTTTANFTLATTERYKDRITGELKEQTEWHNIVCWRNLAEIAEKYITKGSQIFVEGRIRTRSYKDKNGDTRYITEVVADNIQLLGRRDSEQQDRERRGQTAPCSEGGRNAGGNDDLSF